MVACMSRTDDFDDPRARQFEAGPIITVLMPVYNGSAYLIRQMESILSQEVRDLTVVALDDGSTDGSFEILAGFATRDTRVQVCRSEVNRGFISSISYLLGQVETRYFALADQDDVWDSDKLSTSIAQLQRIGVSLVYSDVRLMRRDGSVYEKSLWRSRGVNPISGTDPLPFVFSNPVLGHTIVAEREVALSAHPIPESLKYHEIWLVGAACQLGGVTYIDKALGSYRVHGRNVVGPPPKSVGVRARRILLGDALAVRSETRARALASLSLVYPDFAGIAAGYCANGISARLRHAPEVARMLIEQRGPLGSRALVEFGLYLLRCVWPASDQGSVNVTQEQHDQQQQAGHEAPGPVSAK